MIFGDKSYFDTYFGKMLCNFSVHSGQIHYPFVTLNCWKNVSDKYIYIFFCHKSINQPQY